MAMSRAFSLAEFSESIGAPLSRRSCTTSWAPSSDAKCSKWKPSRFVNGTSPWFLILKFAAKKANAITVSCRQRKLREWVKRKIKCWFYREESGMENLCCLNLAKFRYDIIFFILDLPRPPFRVLPRDMPRPPFRVLPRDTKKLCIFTARSAEIFNYKNIYYIFIR